MVRALIFAAIASILSSASASACIGDAVGRDHRTSQLSSLTAYRVEPSRATRDHEMEKLMDRALRGETDLERAVSKLLAEHESAEEKFLPLIEKRLLNWK